MTAENMLEHIDARAVNNTGWSVGDRFKFNIRDDEELRGEVETINYYHSEDNWVAEVKYDEGFSGTGKEILSHLVKE
jgi:hypothetical protein